MDEGVVKVLRIFLLLLLSLVLLMMAECPGLYDSKRRFKLIVRSHLMIRLKLMELYDRGLKNFESLSPLERDAFVLNDVDIYHEMEGDFVDYLLSAGHEPELSWLAN